jgi:hypothetical protein
MDEEESNEGMVIQRNGYSARNYQLIDEESTRRMGIPSGITSSRTRKSLTEGDSARNYHLKQSTRNPPEEWDKDGNK